MPEQMLTFTAPPPPEDPVEFSINGEVFTAAPFLPGTRFLHYSKVFSQASTGLVSTALIEEFFNEILAETNEAERFWKFANDPASGITASLLAEMFLAIFARYTSGPEERSRPTEPPKPSRSGRSKTQDGSTENSDSQASTPPPTPPSL